jgi:hypothetical protein
MREDGVSALGQGVANFVALQILTGNMLRQRLTSNSSNEIQVEIVTQLVIRTPCGGV